MWQIFDNQSSWMFLLGLSLLIIILMRRFYRYSARTKRRNRHADRHKSPMSSDRLSLQDAPPEILRWQVEMHDTARDLTAELDSKISVLRTLVRMAEDETQRLERAIARADRLGIARRHDSLAELERVAEELPGDSELSSLGDLSGTAPKAYAFPVSEDARQKIYAMADEGQNTLSIADQVGVTIGEVEMVLGLRRGG